MLELLDNDGQGSDGPTSPLSEGTRDGVAKVVDALMGVDMIISFSLAMVQAMDERFPRQTPNLNKVCMHGGPLL